MSPHQHSKVGIGIFEIVASTWLFTMYNSAPLCLHVPVRKLINEGFTCSFPFTNANVCAWIGMRTMTPALDLAAHRLKLGIRHIMAQTLLHLSTCRQEARDRKTEACRISGALTESDSPSELYSTYSSNARSVLAVRSGSGSSDSSASCCRNASVRNQASFFRDSNDAGCADLSGRLRTKNPSTVCRRPWESSTSMMINSKMVDLKILPRDKAGVLGKAVRHVVGAVAPLVDQRKPVE